MEVSGWPRSLSGMPTSARDRGCVDSGVLRVWGKGLGVEEGEGRAKGETSGICGWVSAPGEAGGPRVLPHPRVPDRASSSLEHRIRSRR